MPDTSAIEFWSCDEGDEHLIYTDISEAVEAWAVDLLPAPLPETVEVYGFERCELPSDERLSEGVLTHLLEWLDEDFGNPDDWTKPTDAMKAAALTFVRAIRPDYFVWTCRLATKQTVRVADHVPAEWLTPTTGDT